MAERRTRWSEVVGHIADNSNADVIVYNGTIKRWFDRSFIDLVAQKRKRPNVILILVTTGGDADSAFRIARALQRNYERFTCFVSGFCKSAGTLIAVGAHELVVCDHGELGPLDIQLSKKDALWEQESGAVVDTALRVVQQGVRNV